MKTDLDKEVDELIKRALSREEAKYYEKLDEKPVIHEIFQLYSGKNRWLNIYATTVTFVFLFGAIYAAIMFFDAVGVKEMLLWVVAFLFCTICISMLKIWSWMEMNKNSMHRELKRLELQISALAGQKQMDKEQD